LNDYQRYGERPEIALRKSFLNHAKVEFSTGEQPIDDQKSEQKLEKNLQPNFLE